MSNSPGLLSAARTALAAGLGITLVLAIVPLAGLRAIDPHLSATPLLAQSAPPPPLSDEPPRPVEQPTPTRPPTPANPTRGNDPASDPFEQPAAPMSAEPNELPTKSPIDLAADALLGVLEESFEQVGDKLDDLRQRLDQFHDAQDQKRQAEIERLHDVVKRLEAEAARQAERAQPPRQDEASSSEALEAARNEDRKIHIVQDATSGRLTVNVQQAEFADVLRRLGQVTHTSILPDPSVNLPITAYLHDVAPEEAFKVLLEAQGCLATETVSGIRIARRTQEASGTPANKKVLVTKLYRSRHLTAQDLERIVWPLLTPGIGRFSVIGPRSDLAPGFGVDPSFDSTPGGSCASGSALLIVDQPEVLSQVDRILQELDVPPSGW